MRPEKSLVWLPMRQELQRQRWHSVRIEDKHQQGIADLNITIPAVCDWWIEMKYRASVPKHGAVRIGLEAHQGAWLVNAQRGGKHVGVVGRVGKVWCLWYAPSYVAARGIWGLLVRPTPWQILQEHASCVSLSVHDILRFLYNESLVIIDAHSRPGFKEY